MKLLTSITTPMHHCEDAVSYLLRALSIKFTNSYLKRELVEHPDYPSLNAIADVLGISYDVACAPIKVTIKDFINSEYFRGPFLAQIRTANLSHDVFAVVINISYDSLEWYDPATKKIERGSFEVFNKYYKGLVLIVEAGEEKEELRYEYNRKKEKELGLSSAIAFWSLPLLTVLTIILYVIREPHLFAIIPVVFTFLVLMGALVSGALLLHEVDQFNPVIKQVCQSNEKVNCSAVLNSKYSKIMGISWSSIGFAYFTGMLLYLLTSGISDNALLLSAWTSLPTFFYIVFSLYYQWKVIRQWCRLCLMVQSLLMLLIITALIGGFYDIQALRNISFYLITSYASPFLFALTAVIVLVPVLRKGKGSQQKTIELQRMKHDPRIFEGLLTKQKEIEMPGIDLGITLGKKNSVYKIIKVCNPYCGPCAKAHPLIEDLISNIDEVSVQIIFAVSDEESDEKRAAAAHLMAIAAKGNEIQTRQALDDWYLADIKNYDVFATKYPVNGDLREQSNNITYMRQWCEKVEIIATPTFFISLNNHSNDRSFYALPEQYTITDLKYFLTN